MINEFVRAQAGSVWVLPLVFALCTIDGFFPPLPSESIIVALAAVSASVGEPNMWWVFVVAATGAMLGDNIAYAIGRHGGLTRLNDSKSHRVRDAMGWAHRELDQRGAMIIIAARYIPVGRVVVNITAGATKFRWRKFFALDFVAALSWAAYSIAIGTLAGRWLHDNPLLATAVAVAGGVLLGLLIDRLLHKFMGVAPERAQHRKGRRVADESREDALEDSREESP
ncbi:DedA family protein [Ornithinimicrobium cryptoxanthini]|uniref:DedA family protein n=1 Tax=Ornithinimicrobium cryptoxanthini TaxID=2934161 RepID=UPI0021189DCA|nr:DedA family protein [Ornithinimicrobium cryptoxanthini]